VTPVRAETCSNSSTKRTKKQKKKRKKGRQHIQPFENTRRKVKMGTVG